MTMVINKAGTKVPYEIAVELMDDEIMEELHNQIAPCTKQEFFAAYEQAHADKHGEKWELSRENPTF